MGNLVRAFAVAAAIGCAVPAQSEIQTFIFTGECFDCYGGQGVATGELVLRDYVYGQNIDSNSFVSFHYDGTDMYHAFTIDQSNAWNYGGVLEGPRPAAQDFLVGNADDFLEVETPRVDEFHNNPGFWRVGTDVRNTYDVGGNGSFTLRRTVSAAPEPAAWGLMIIGVGIAGTALRRRQRTIVTYA